MRLIKECSYKHSKFSPGNDICYTKPIMHRWYKTFFGGNSFLCMSKPESSNSKWTQISSNEVKLYKIIAIANLS